MPISYTLHPDLGLVVTRFTGRPDDDEFLDAYTRLLYDDEYALGMNELADLRQAEGLAITTAGLHRLDAVHRERYAGSAVEFRTAILSQLDQPYGVARMYQAFADGGPENVRVFRDPGDALEWLGLDTDALDGEI